MPKMGGWFIADGPSRADRGIARIPIIFDETLPLYATATALTWIVGFMRYRLDRLVKELERQGLRTSSLPVVSPPLLAYQKTKPGAEWPRGLP